MEIEGTLAALLIAAAIAAIIALWLIPRRRDAPPAGRVAAAIEAAAAAGVRGPPAGPPAEPRPCARCGARAAWHVADVHQPDDEFADGHAPIAVHAVDLGEREGGRVVAGRVEALVCVACGLTTWYAIDANATLRALVALAPGCTEAAHPCACSADRAWRIERPCWPAAYSTNLTVELCVTYRLSGRSVRAIGPLVATVCQTCGRVHLSCTDPGGAGVPEVAVRTPVEAPCPRCAGTEAWVVSTVERPNHQYSGRLEPLHVTAIGRSPPGVGLLAAQVCCGCGDLTWTAREADLDLDALARAAGSGVRRV